MLLLRESRAQSAQRNLHLLAAQLGVALLLVVQRAHRTRTREGRHVGGRLGEVAGEGRKRLAHVERRALDPHELQHRLVHASLDHLARTVRVTTDVLDHLGRVVARCRAGGLEREQLQQPLRHARRAQQLQLECVVLACAARDALEPLGQLASRRVAAEHRPRELVQVDQHLHALVARREEGADVQRHKGPEADRHDALVERLRRLGWWAGGAREQPWSWEPAERCARREAA
mmetsp:Transcript_7206/g.16882  ORF Transcript_7206/g.16882 Transcript_7206/m.16882 type:complete len:232 (+) Transcript_7206:657-1352(+)